MENGSAMTVEREVTFDDEAIHHRQLNPVATVLSTATWLSRSVNCILTYPFLKPPRAYAYEVSQEWIDLNLFSDSERAWTHLQDLSITDKNNY